MNQSCRELAKHLLRHNSGSTATLYQYMYGVHRFSRWINRSPDQLIAECKTSDGLTDQRQLEIHIQRLDDFVGDLQAEGLAPGTISNHVKGVKALYRVNGLKLELPYRLSKRAIYSDRAPRPEELQRLIDLASLRDKVIVALLALGGFREGTLVRLRYRHVADDLERGIVPLHVHVEAEITKGKYADYDTFLGAEAVEYLRLYLDKRRVGSPELRTPPETIIGESPLIRNIHSARVKPISPSRVHSIIHNLYREAGLLRGRNGRRYELRVHSIRKFFRTQLAALGVNRDYIEYMMGHKISTYHDVKMKGVEFLRNIYAASGLSIRPKTRVSKIEALKEIIRAWGMDPEEILTKKALAEPHRVYAGPRDREEDQVRALSTALKDMMRKELMNAKADSQAV
jgi:integrase